MFIITGIIIPLVLYLITLPLQSFLFVLRQTLKSEEKRLKGRLVGSSKLKHSLGGINTNLRDRITEKNSDKSSVDVKSISMRIRSLKALQSLIASISFLITFIRSVAQTIACLVVTLVVTIVPIIILIVASVAGYFLLELEDIDFSFSGNGASVNIVEENPTSTGSTGVATNVSEWLKKCEEMGNFYIKSVATYNQDLYVNCDLLGGRVRADCTGYMYACLRYAGLISDTAEYAPSSHHYVPGKAYKGDTDVMVKKLQDAGFALIEVTKDFKWQSGDIAAVNGHVELVVSVEGETVKTFGWGDIRTKFPHSNYSSHNKFTVSRGSAYTHCYRLK